MKEENQTNSKFLDTNLWIAYITKKHHSDIIDSEEKLFLSILSLFEIKKKLLKDNISKVEIDENMKFIKEKSIILSVNESIVDKAVEKSIFYKVPAIDSLIYATALLNKSTFITLENDFRGLENVQVLDIVE